jgi:dTDP-4-amino-4,6-dideoxygalactose transaminase
MIKKTRININTSKKIYFKVLLSFIFNQGKDYKKIFLQKLKDFLLTDNLLVTSQGRVAAYNIFKVIISDKKNEILISPYTLTEVVNAILYAGGKPIYVEINLKTGLPLEVDLDKKINEKTAGLVLTHLFSNKENILEFNKRYQKKLVIIEDVAINFGAKIDQKKFLGTIFDYGFYSFGVMKNLCTFHGGAIFSRDKDMLNLIEENLKKNIDYPIILSLKLFFFCILIDVMYSKYIYNFFTHYILKLSLKNLDRLMYPGVYPKFPSIIPKHYYYKFQKNFAIAGIENLKVLNQKIDQRIKNVKLYEKYLIDDLKLNMYDFYNINSFLEYPILLNKNRNKFLSEKLLAIGYDVRHTWYVNSARFIKMDSKFNNLVISDKLHESVLSLPTHNKINETDIINICELINYYEK